MMKLKRVNYRVGCALAVAALVSRVAASDGNAAGELKPALSAPVRELVVEPASVTLTHARDVHGLLVSGKLADGTLRDLSRHVAYESLAPQIVAVDARGVLRPVAAGTGRVRVAGFGQTTEIEVAVKNVAEKPVSFANDVITVLTKSGCNSGACHGAASGKNGFKVSLRGYDPAGDFGALTHDALGRRMNRLEIEKSLMLLKSVAHVPHEGGRRFAVNSEYYEILDRWIREGAKSDVDTAPKLVGLRVIPESRVLPEPGPDQQLLALARYGDGTERDVTRHCRFSSNNESSADVTDDGLVRTTRKGEAAIMVRFGSTVAVSRLLVLRPAPDFVWTEPPHNNFIDDHVFAKLRDMRILPSELCTDEEFLRRASLDIIGLPPTPEEVRAFRADRSPDKRARATDRLLERPEYADFWALKWADLLRIKFNTLQEKGVWGLHTWLKNAFAANLPYDEFARQLIASSGSTAESPPAAFHRIFGSPDDASEATSQLFFGIRLLCAKCHDHPFEKWTQNDYYGMSAFFSQVGRKSDGRPSHQIVFRRDVAAQSTHKTTGAPVQPKLLDAESIEIGGDRDARAALAGWITSDENPFFARAFVNRMWSYFFGRGIIDPVDDIRSSNPPTNEPLLAALADDFKKQRYDIKQVIRTITGSRTYQLSSQTNPSNEDDAENFSHAPVRRLTAEQMLDSLAQATGIAEKFTMLYTGGPGSTAYLPVGNVRAAQIPDSQIGSYFLDIFGRPVRESPCECERRQEPTLTQALHLINGSTVARRLGDPNSNLTKLLAAHPADNRKLVEELYLLVLARMPNETEHKIGNDYLAAGDRSAAAQDLMWALFNTREFLFNH